jgi:tetratricopeptide (TPR) repeat protein
LQPAITLSADELANRAVARSQAGDKAGAWQDFQAAIDLLPDHPKLLTMAAEVAVEVSGDAEAEALLRRAIAAAPSDVMVRWKLVDFLVARDRDQELEADLEWICGQIPDNAGINRLLGQVKVALVKYDEAIEAFERELEINPHDTGALMAMAKAKMLSYEHFDQADAAFDRAFRMADNLHNCLAEIADLYVSIRRFERVIEFCEAVDLNEMDDLLQPLTRLSYGVALLESGRHAEASENFRAAMRACDRLMETAEPVQQISLGGIKTRILHAAGDHDSARQMLERLSDLLPPEEYYYKDGEYLPDTPSRIRYLENIVGGRDVAVLLQGPSLNDVRPYAGQLAALDVCFASVNKFHTVEEQILLPQRRRLDVVLSANPHDFRLLPDHFTDFLDRDDENLLITSEYAMHRLPPHLLPSDDFVGRYDRKLIYFNSGKPYIATPIDPLHFVMPGNSLSVLLPMLVLGRPRRIFLFGADGGGQEDQTGPAYFTATGGPAEQKQRNREEGLRRFRNEAWVCDRNTDIAMQAMSTLHYVPVPPIFNCCPGSSHKAFEKITVEQGLSMLSDG